jgi:hypothetical protein
MAAASLLPWRVRARYRDEWIAELEEYGRESVGLMLPALRILITAPATHRNLYPGVLADLISRPLRRQGDRMFATLDTEAYWRSWQITKSYAGVGRRYRDPRFDTIDPSKSQHQPVA